MEEAQNSSLDTCKETGVRNATIAMYVGFFVSSTWLLFDSRREPSAYTSICRPDHWGWMDTRPLTQALAATRRWVGATPVGGVRRTAAGTSQQWPAVEMGLEGENCGSFIQHSSQKERETYFQAACAELGQAGGLQEAPVLEEGQNVSALWFSTGRHIVPAHCRWGPFSCSSGMESGVGAAYHPASAALESGRPCRSPAPAMDEGLRPAVLCRMRRPGLLKAEPGEAL